MYRERKCSVSEHGCYVVCYGPQIKTICSLKCMLVQTVVLYMDVGH